MTDEQAKQLVKLDFSMLNDIRFLKEGKVKRCLFVIALMMVFISDASAVVRNIQDNYKLTYTITDTNGNHVGSQTPTVQIQRASDGYWIDFSDATFKSTSWTEKTTTLTEDSENGFYHYTFNPPDSETVAEEYILVVDNSDQTYGDRQALAVTYQAIGTSVLVATDNIGINWADVSNPTTAVNLSGTTISTTQAVASVSGAVGSVTGAVGSVTAGVTVTTNNDKTGYALSAAGIDAIWDETQSGHSTAGSFGIYLDAKVSEAGGGTLTAADIWDYDVSEYSAAGEAGTYLKGAASAGDPWLTELPGTYTEDQAGAYLPALIKKSRGR